MKTDRVFDIDLRDTDGTSTSASVAYTNTRHDALRNRDLPNQHPIGAISGLQTLLDGLPKDFLALTDTPLAYTANKMLAVNSAGNAIEFRNIPSGGGGGIGGSGTLNTLPMWTPDGTTLGDSVITHSATDGILVTGKARISNDFTVGDNLSTTLSPNFRMVTNGHELKINLSKYGGMGFDGPGYVAIRAKGGYLAFRSSTGNLWFLDQYAGTSLVKIGRRNDPHLRRFEFRNALGSSFFDSEIDGTFTLRPITPHVKIAGTTEGLDAVADQDYITKHQMETAIAAGGTGFSGKHTDLTDVTTSQHHIRYADSEAVSAMGVLGNSNPLNHARYTDAEAVNAVGAIPKTFLALTDTPSAYTANKMLAVNAAGNAVEFRDIPSGGTCLWTAHTGGIHYVGGKVGVGTALPGAQLSVKIATATTVGISVDLAASQTGHAFQIKSIDGHNIHRIEPKINSITGDSFKVSANSRFNHVIGNSIGNLLSGYTQYNSLTGEHLLSAATHDVTHNLMVGDHLFEKAPGGIFRNLVVGFNICPVSTQSIHNNLFVGSQIGKLCVEGIGNNLIVGEDVADSVPGSINNVFAMGYRTLYNTSNNNHLNRVVALPAEAFAESTVSLEDAIAVGWRAGYRNTFSGPALFGRDASATENNQIVLGSDFYSGGIHLATSRWRFGKTSVVGQVLTASDALGNAVWKDATGGGGTSLWSTNAHGIHYTGGKVGIGKHDPAYLLDVAGSARVTALLVGAGTTPAYMVLDGTHLHVANPDGNTTVGSGNSTHLEGDDDVSVTAWGTQVTLEVTDRNTGGNESLSLHVVKDSVHIRHQGITVGKIDSTGKLWLKFPHDIGQL